MVSIQFHDIVLQHIYQGLGSIVYSQLAENVGQMILHSLFTNKQGLCYILIAKSISNAGNNIHLSIGQPFIAALTPQVQSLFPYIVQDSTPQRSFSAAQV